LTTAANASLSSVEELLVGWTIKHYCSAEGCEFATKLDSDVPVFPTSVIEAKGMPVDLDLLNESEMLVSSKVDDEILVGLSGGYVTNHLDFPLGCWLSLGAWNVASLSVSMLTGSIVLVASTLWNATLAYPLVSFLSLVALWIIRLYRLRAARRLALIRDTAEVKHMVYDQLMSIPAEHVVLHVRDGIAHDLFPNSKKDRQAIVRRVWPRVVADVRSDNRVLKANKMVQGVPRDVWQWVATPAKGKRVVL